MTTRRGLCLTLISPYSAQGRTGWRLPHTCAGSGADVRVLGDPMSFWRIMPTGMLLRSNWTATCISDYRGPLSLDALLRRHRSTRFDRPVPLDQFIEYGMWVQQQVAAGSGPQDRGDAGQQAGRIPAAAR